MRSQFGIHTGDFPEWSTNAVPNDVAHLESRQRFATAKLRHRAETHHAIIGEPADEPIDVSRA